MVPGLLGGGASTPTHWWEGLPPCPPAAVPAASPQQLSRPNPTATLASPWPGHHQDPKDINTAHTATQRLCGSQVSSSAAGP